MNKSIFLDRDGVLNKLVYNPKTGEYESPHYEKDLEIFPWVIPALHKLQTHGFLLFVISNQPSYAKGKTTLENIKAIEQAFHTIADQNGIKFTEYYYCYHHPHGIVKEFAGECNCRKPKPFFINKAREMYDLDTTVSWIVGDRDTDIECGKAAGLKTVLIKERKSASSQGESKPDFVADDLEKAVVIILQGEK